VPPVVILNKVDLLPHLDFSVALAIANVRQVNPDATILEISARTGGGIEDWYSWIRSQVVAARQFALIERDGARPWRAVSGIWLHGRVHGKVSIMSINIAIRFVLGTAATLVVPAVAFAHIGTGVASGLAHGFAHPFTGIDHILAMVAVGVLAASLGGRALWSVPMTFMVLMAIGAWLGLAGVVLPYVETVIMLSVLVLGLVVAVPREWPVAAAMVLVGFFAVFHGHAHGTEMGETISIVEYGLGFICATAILHLTGIVLRMGVARLGAIRARQISQIGGLAVAAAGVGLLAMMS
jgi:urease accessory protein